VLTSPLGALLLVLSLGVMLAGIAALAMRRTR
jgi:hypothetical protein